MEGHENELIPEMAQIYFEVMPLKSLTSTLTLHAG